AADVFERSEERAKRVLAEIEEERRREENRRKEEQRRREEQEREVAAVRTLIQEGKYGEATQLLNKAMAAEVFERSDERAKQLLAEIEEKRRREENRRKEEQRRREEQEREVVAVRTLIQEGKYGEATQLLNKAMAAEVFERSDERAKQLLAEIEEKR